MVQKFVTYSEAVCVWEEISSWIGTTDLSPVVIGENETGRVDFDGGIGENLTNCDGGPFPFPQSLHWQLDVQSTPSAWQSQYFLRHLVVQQKNDLRVRPSRE
jgi:hypothetical protein